MLPTRVAMGITSEKEDDGRLNLEKPVVLRLFLHDTINQCVMDQERFSVTRKNLKYSTVNAIVRDYKDMLVRFGVL